MMQVYKIRGIGIFFFFCFCYLIVIGNLIYLQIIQHSFFKELGQKQYHVTTISLPPRGIILDRNNNFLAINKDSLAAFILPRQLQMKPQLEQFLSRYFPAALDRLKKNPQAHFLYMQRKLTPAQIDIITKSGISDINILNEPSRFYPLPAAAALIGITDIDNKGLFGLELQFDQQLTGTPSTMLLEKDARSGHFYFKKEIAQEGLNACPLHLTIDSDIQFLAYEELMQTVLHVQAKEGAVVVLDPETGDILAMTNFPSFDPNNFCETDLARTKNTCLTEAYELGSVFKICTALAALEEGVVTPDELIDCKNTLTTYIDGRKINTVHEAGIISFEEVIAQSNNIGIAQVAQRLGPKLYDHYTKLGFCKKSGLPFPGENKGFINPPHNWSKQSIISLSYGYEVTANLLQLARAFAIIANGGYWIDMQLTNNTPRTIKKQKLYADNTIAIIQNMMEQTTQKGTARKAHIKGYRIMCKTGTANLLENGHYNPDKNIFTCAGIIEKGNYKKVIVVFIKETAQKDQYAATIAAPLFERIAQKVLIKDRVI
jgi:cell division protein FtsI (penicillin-binding protein 3)